jgi:Domain of unknown function (DUF4386)
MNVNMNTVRLLGAAQLIVFFASLFSDQLLKSIFGSGSTSDSLVNVSENLTRMRISNFVALINSLAIIVLGCLFYIVFSGEYKLISLVALGCFLAEAITLAVSKLGAYALIPLSQGFLEAGAPASSHFQTMGDFLYNGIDRKGYDIHMLFFCVGGILWYSLLLRSGAVPQTLALWGLVSICLLTIPSLLALLDREYLPAMLLALPYAPFELVLGIWLIFRGFN